MSVHANRAHGDLAMIAQLAEENMLGEHLQVIHALCASAQQRAALVASGTSVSISPWSELLIGYGVTTVREPFDAGVEVTQSVDTLPLTGTADMFSIMRLTLELHRACRTSSGSGSIRLGRYDVVRAAGRSSCAAGVVRRGGSRVLGAQT